MSDYSANFSVVLGNAPDRPARVECPCCAGRGSVPMYIYEGTGANPLYPAYWRRCSECGGLGKRPLRVADFKP